MMHMSDRYHWNYVKGHWLAMAGADSGLGWKKFTWFFHVYTKKTNQCRGFDLSTSWKGYGVYLTILRRCRSRPRTANS